MRPISAGRTSYSLEELNATQMIEILFDGVLNILGRKEWVVVIIVSFSRDFRKRSLSWSVEIEIMLERIRSKSWLKDKIFNSSNSKQ